MQLQHMRMLDQFQNGNLPLNLVRERRDRCEEKETERDAEAEHTRHSSVTSEATEPRLVNQLTQKINIENTEEFVYSGTHLAVYKISIVIVTEERHTVPSSGLTQTASLC